MFCRSFEIFSFVCIKSYKLIWASISLVQVVGKQVISGWIVVFTMRQRNITNYMVVIMGNNYSMRGLYNQYGKLKVFNL